MFAWNCEKIMKIFLKYFGNLSSPAIDKQLKVKLKYK